MLKNTLKILTNSLRSKKHIKFLGIKPKGSSMTTLSTHLSKPITRAKSIVPIKILIRQTKQNILNTVEGTEIKILTNKILLPSLLFLEGAS